MVASAGGISAAYQAAKKGSSIIAYQHIVSRSARKSGMAYINVAAVKNSGIVNNKAALLLYITRRDAYY